MTLTIEQCENWRGKFLKATNQSYDMDLYLYLQDIPYWLNNPDQHRWGLYSYSNDISSKDKEAIKEYIYDNKLLKPVGYAKRLCDNEVRLKAYPLDILLKYIKRSKIRSRYGELLNKAVSSI